MAINKPFDRHFITLSGGVKKTGGSLNLGKGQVALVNISKTSPKGATVVASTAGLSKFAKVLELREGIATDAHDRSHSNKGKSTPAFSLDEVRRVRVSVPKTTKAQVDEVVIGFDGFDENSSFSFNTGDRYFNVALELSGGTLQYLGSPNATEMVYANVDITRCNTYDKCDDCEDCSPVDCKEVVLEAIEQLKNHQVRGGVKVEDIVEITPVFKCTSGVTAEIEYDYYTLSVCDTGEDDALALVQTQYDAKVSRKDRKGSTSVYEILVPTADVPADYEQTLPSIIKGCDTCPDGYDPALGGFVYAITIEDDGVDMTDYLDISKLVSGSIIKSGNSNGVGFYTAIFDSAITDAEIADFLATNADAKTATFSFVGETADICEWNGEPNKIAWVKGKTCKATEIDYSIVLRDDKCGKDRLSELQGAYPNLNIYHAEASVTIVVAGNSDTNTINVAGTNYTVTWDTSKTTTVTNFVTAEGAALLADGVTATNVDGNLVLTGAGDIIANVTIGSGDLDLTLGAVVALEGAGCQHEYITKVVTNIVCDECDDVFLDYYRAEAPGKYDGVEWTSESDYLVPGGDCVCGIRIKGKMFYLEGNEALRDMVGFTETSVKVQVSAMFPTDEIREGIGRIPRGAFTGKYLTRFKPRTHLAGNMLDLERMSNAYFLDRANYNYMGRILTGTTSNFVDLGVQYVDYVVEIAHGTTTQGFAKQHSHVVDYHILAEVGRHQDVEDLVNDIAANAGVETIRAF